VKGTLRAGEVVAAPPARVKRSSKGPRVSEGSPPICQSDESTEKLPAHLDKVAKAKPLHCGCVGAGADAHFHLRARRHRMDAVKRTTRTSHRPACDVSSQRPELTTGLFSQRIYRNGSIDEMAWLRNGKRNDATHECAELRCGADGPCVCSSFKRRVDSSSVRSRSDMATATATDRHSHTTHHAGSYSHCHSSPYATAIHTPRGAIDRTLKRNNKQ